MAETATVAELLVRIRADLSDLERGMAKAQGLTGAFATRTAPGVRAVSNAFRGLAFSAVGVPGPIGRVSSILLTMGTGGTVTLAVLAGLAAIGGALKLMSLQADRALQKFKEMAEAAVTRASFERGVMGVVAGLLDRKPSAAQQLQNIAGTIALIQQAMAMTVPEEGVFGILGEKRLRFTTEQLDTMRKAIQLLHGDASILQMELSKLRIGQFAGAPGLAPADTRLAGISAMAKVGLAQAGHPFLQPINMDIAARIGADRWIQKFSTEIRQKYEVARMIGESIGMALADGINAVLSGGNFLKALGRSLLSIAINVASGLAGRAIGAALFRGGPEAAGLLSGSGSATGWTRGGPSFNFAGFPPATNPLASARDAEWLRFLGASNLQLRQYGFR